MKPEYEINTMSEHKDDQRGNQRSTDLLACPKCEDDIDVGPSYDDGMIAYDCECGEGPETMCLTDEEARAEWNAYVRQAT